MATPSEQDIALFNQLIDEGRYEEAGALASSYNYSADDVTGYLNQTRNAGLTTADVSPYMTPTLSQQTTSTPTGIEDQMRRDYLQYFETTKPGEYTDFAGGTLYKADPDRAIFITPSGEYTIRKDSSISDVANTIPEIANAWQQQYGYTPSGAAYATETGWNPILASYSDASRDPYATRKGYALDPELRSVDLSAYQNDPNAAWEHLATSVYGDKPLTLNDISRLESAVGAVGNYSPTASGDTYQLQSAVSPLQQASTQYKSTLTDPEIQRVFDATMTQNQGTPEALYGLAEINKWSPEQFAQYYTQYTGSDYYDTLAATNQWLADTGRSLDAFRPYENGVPVPGSIPVAPTPTPSPLGEISQQPKLDPAMQSQLDMLSYLYGDNIPQDLVMRVLTGDTAQPAPQPAPQPQQPTGPAWGGIVPNYGTGSSVYNPGSVFAQPIPAPVIPNPATATPSLTGLVNSSAPMYGNYLGTSGAPGLLKFDQFGRLIS
jgi:hypothetical protein